MTMTGSKTQPILPPEAQHDIQAARERGQLAFVRVVEPPARADEVCPNCNGTSRLLVAFTGERTGHTTLLYYGHRWHDVTTKAYPCPVCTDRILRQQLLWQRSGLSPWEQAYSLDFLARWPTKAQALAQARKIQASFPYAAGLVMLYGPNGAGKTGILMSLVASAIKCGVPAHYTWAEALLDEIGREFGRALVPDDGDLLTRYAHIPVLAIDELGQIRDTVWGRLTLRRLLDWRYRLRHQCLTLMASETALADWGEGWEFLQSRLSEATVIIVPGPDVRRGGGAVAWTREADTK